MLADEFLVFQRRVADCHDDLEGVGLFVAGSSYNVVSAPLGNLDRYRGLLGGLTLRDCGSVHYLYRSFFIGVSS